MFLQGRPPHHVVLTVYAVRIVVVRAPLAMLAEDHPRLDPGSPPRLEAPPRLQTLRVRPVLPKLTLAPVPLHLGVGPTQEPTHTRMNLHFGGHSAYPLYTDKMSLNPREAQTALNTYKVGQYLPT